MAYNQTIWHTSMLMHQNYISIIMCPATFNNLRYNLKMNNFFKVRLRKQKSKSHQHVKPNNFPIQHIIHRLVPFTKLNFLFTPMQQVLLTTRFFTISTFDIKLEYTTIKTTFLTLSQSLVNLLALFIINLLT